MLAVGAELPEPEPLVPDVPPELPPEVPPPEVPPDEEPEVPLVEPPEVPLVEPEVPPVVPDVPLPDEPELPPVEPEVPPDEVLEDPPDVVDEVPALPLLLEELPHPESTRAQATSAKAKPRSAVVGIFINAPASNALGNWTDRRADRHMLEKKLRDILDCGAAYKTRNTISTEALRTSGIADNSY